MTILISPSEERETKDEASQPPEHEGSATEVTRQHTDTKMSEDRVQSPADGLIKFFERHSK
jgi:hypothetical protein